MGACALLGITAVHTATISKAQENRLRFDWIECIADSSGKFGQPPADFRDDPLRTCREIPSVGLSCLFKKQGHFCELLPGLQARKHLARSDRLAGVSKLQRDNHAR